jgi:hypothetical protein
MPSRIERRLRFEYLIADPGFSPKQDRSDLLRSHRALASRLYQQGRERAQQNTKPPPRLAVFGPDYHNPGRADGHGLPLQTIARGASQHCDDDNQRDRCNKMVTLAGHQVWR